MKKIFIVVFILGALSFSRTSTKHRIVVSPEYAVTKSAFGIITAQDYSSEDSVQWKRRHKRRKKTRKPQRGR